MAAYPLLGRTLFITGGASGIGAEVARQAASRGARLALVDIDAAGAERVASELPAAIAIAADVRDYDTLVAAAEKTRAAFGGIDVVMANAGVEIAATGRGISIDDLERLVDVNFTGVLKTVKATASAVIDRRGYILITASGAAFAHLPIIGHYAGTKAGVEAYGDALRIELAHKGVGVGIAYFGFIDTPMLRAGRSDPILAEFEARSGGNPLGKTYPVSRAGGAVVRGIERRARRVTFPRYLRVSMLARAALPRLLERSPALRDVPELVDRLDERDLGATGTRKEQLLS